MLPATIEPADTMTHRLLASRALLPAAFELADTLPHRPRLADCA
ncbi:hypothetical protein [Aeromonas molluscorum]